MQDKDISSWLDSRWLGQASGKRAEARTAVWVGNISLVTQWGHGRFAAVLILFEVIREKEGSHIMHEFFVG